MTRPTPQTCRVCGNRFIGSDSLGKPCPDCREMPTDPGPSVLDYIVRENTDLAKQEPVFLKRSEVTAPDDIFQIAKRAAMDAAYAHDDPRTDSLLPAIRAAVNAAYFITVERASGLAGEHYDRWKNAGGFQDMAVGAKVVRDSITEMLSVPKKS